MSKKNSNVLAIAIMFFLFGMISFVTGLQNPMGIIVKEQFGASNFMSQLGNAANFIAYAFLGLPAGMILKKKGYKFTSLAAVTVGFIGVGILWLSGFVGDIFSPAISLLSPEQASSANNLIFGIYLAGAFISGFSMCMLNTVVNPMLNTLGGGGNKGNQLIQFGGSVNSLCATIVPVLAGYLIGDTAKATISNANPALYIAMGVFALAFVIIIFSTIPEPELEAKAEYDEETEPMTVSIKHLLSQRHFVFGIIAIFIYVGVEVGIPNFVNLYLTTEYVLPEDEVRTTVDENVAVDIQETIAFESAVQTQEMDSLVAETAVQGTVVEVLPESVADDCKISETIAHVSKAVAGTIVGIYWLLMLCGRLIGGAIGGKVSSRVMMISVSSLALVLLLLGMFLPETLVKFPTVTSELKFALADVPLNVVFFILCGLCTSVMWGSIFNLAVEGLGKYTSLASGVFMMLVCGGGILPLIQGAVADATSIMTGYWVIIAGVAYMLLFALFFSKPKAATK